MQVNDGSLTSGIIKRGPGLKMEDPSLLWSKFGLFLSPTLGFLAGQAGIVEIACGSDLHHVLAV